jgi:aspartyl aminopeptidase
MKDYIPKLGDLILKYVGKEYMIGMIVEEYGTSWSVEWFGRDLLYSGYTQTELTKARQSFLKFKKTL